MTDPRIEKLAKTLVAYSVALKPGDTVALLGDESGLPLVHEIYKRVILAGGNCSTILFDGKTLSQAIIGADGVMADFFMRHASDDQIQWISPMERWVTNEADAMIQVRSTSNTRRNSGVDPRRVSLRSSAHAELVKARTPEQQRQRWSVTIFPTEALAQEADMNLEDFENFVYKATFADQPDPVACWRKVEADQQKYVDWLKGRKQVQVRGPNIDLTLSIEGRTFVNSSATHNMPSGEIFTGPVEDSANGWVRFTYPAINAGRQIEGVDLKFEDGKCVSATARKSQGFLLAQLDTDPGARYLGEFAIGTNYGIDRFIGTILFDEKIGGTIHMALGHGYPETGSKAKSAIHWDMICDMRRDSEILVDGDVLYRNGQFVF